MVLVLGRQVRVWCSLRRKEAEGSTAACADGLSDFLRVLAPSNGRKSCELLH